MRRPRMYAANKGKRVNPVNLKIRIAKKGAPATREEIRDALEYASRHGEAPPGFRIFPVNWEHPHSGGSGDVTDMQSFYALIRHMKSEIRIEPVKRTR